jgi:Zn finger protein HypA/HybF involved in hydrogenase expression
MNNSKQEYNEEPVFYCKNCLSLKIKTVQVDSNLDYCDECGSTDIAQTNIEEWRNIYKNRYGIDFLNK